MIREEQKSEEISKIRNFPTSQIYISKTKNKKNGAAQEVNRVRGIPLIHMQFPI